MMNCCGLESGMRSVEQEAELIEQGERRDEPRS